MAALGALSTGVAFVCFAVLIGRVGAARASITVYLVPIVAILLGAGLAAEPVAPLSLVGIGLVLAGAYLASGPARRGHPARSLRSPDTGSELLPQPPSGNADRRTRHRSEIMRLLEPLILSVADAELEDLTQRLTPTRWPDQTPGEEYE